MNYLNNLLTIKKNRRVAPRHIADLKAPVLITAVGISAFDREQCLFLQGHIHDVSLSGLALIISLEDHLELCDFGEGWIMRLLLPLPQEAIEIEVTPVRFQALGGKRREVLIGAHITKMEKRARTLFIEFIHTCEATVLA